MVRRGRYAEARKHPGRHHLAGPVRTVAHNAGQRHAIQRREPEAARLLVGLDEIPAERKGATEDCS
jgi:hypothetical protein